MPDRRRWFELEQEKLKEKLDGMSEEKQLELLASDGKLVKRPLVIGEDFVLVGFKPEEWEKVLLK